MFGYKRNRTRSKSTVSPQSHEQVFVMGALVCAFLLLAGLGLILVESLITREDAFLQYDAEQAFSSFIFRLRGSEQNLEEVLQDEDIVGVAVYDSNGTMLLGLGRVPESFTPVDPQSVKEITRGKASYNAKTGMIEYIRYAQLTVELSIGSGTIPTPLEEYPEIMYVIFDGKGYRSKITTFWFIYAFIDIGLFFLLFAIYGFYKKNRAFRETLTKQESLVSMGEAARTLAHEIKNPLSAIALQTAVLKKTLPLEVQEDLAVIEQEVDRLNKLTNRVGDFLRNPTGELEKFDVGQFLKDIVSRFAFPIPVILQQREKCLIDFDRDRARSVFENLIKNACESRADGSDPEVTVTLGRTWRDVIITIQDRGDGLPEGDEKKVFDPFYTTKVQGSGIGLAISQRFIAANGGTLQLSRRQGGGTTVEVVIPRSKR